MKLKYQYILLFLLVLANSPNTYIGSLFEIVLFIFSLLHLTPTIISNNSKKILLLWGIIGLIMFISFFLHFSSFNNLFWGIVTFFPIIITPFILNNINRHKVIKILKQFTIIELVTMIVQLLSAMIRLKTINVYQATNGGIGDIIAGTSVGFSSTIAISMLCISFVFLNEALKQKQIKSYLWFLTSVLMGFLPSYTAAILVYILSFILFFAFILIKSILKLRLNAKLFFAIFSVSSVFIFFLYLQWKNILYAIHILMFVFSISPPNKIVAYQELFSDFMLNHPIEFLMGTGFGNYSSRAAFIVGGDYLSRETEHGYVSTQPSYIPITPSKYYKKYMHPLFNNITKTKVIGGTIGNSMINAPFSQIITFIGEGGMITLVLFLLIILQLKKINKYNVSLKIYAYFIVGILFIDNWLAFSNYDILFWLLLFYFEKQKKLNMNIGEINENIINS